MNSLTGLCVITVDPQSNQACRVNTNEQQGLMPKIGGNLNKLKTLVGPAQMPQGTEFTIVDWKGDPHDMIYYLMLVEYEKTGQCSLLDERTHKMGLSFKYHKTANNVFQLIYLFKPSNTIA